MTCAICGDDRTAKHRGRWWSPDDGWRWGALCDCCAQDYGPGKVKPAPADYAYEKAQELDVDAYLADTQ